ncbi:transposase family protein, partial [Kineosporia babensis]
TQRCLIRRNRHPSIKTGQAPLVALPRRDPKTDPRSTYASRHWFKTPKGGSLNVNQKAHNSLHSAVRALGERANSILKTTFKALRRWRGCPWRIGDIVAAALVLLHQENGRTT